MGSSIHQTIFNRMPNPAMILNKNLVFVDANDAYCRAVQRHRTEIIGRYVFDVFPNTPERIAQVKESFEKSWEAPASFPESDEFVTRSQIYVAVEWRGRRGTVLYLSQVAGAWKPLLIYISSLGAVRLQ